MSGSGLVYAAIVVTWAAVLIPMWLRRHDATSENRSAERFGQAMRVLSRREGSMDQREVVVPTRPLVAPAVPTGSSSTGSSSTGSSSTGSSSGTRPVVSRPVSPRPVSPRPAAATDPVRSPRSQARASLARRRARSLTVLAGLTAVLGLLGALSVLPVWAPVPAALLLVGFVVHLRIQAKRTAERRRHRPTASARRPGSGRSEPSRGLVVETKGEAVATAVAAPLVADSDPSWQPNPLPLPTYVTAPKAVRPIRVIDLTTPGAWTSGRLLEDEVPVVEETLADAAADAAELDALLEQDVAHDAAGLSAPRRAVND